MKSLLSGISVMNSLRIATGHCRSLQTAANKTVRIVEVGPRDGLQNEKTIIPTDVKVALVNKLSDAGLDYIEVSSFVSPKWVPQMSDSLKVFDQICRLPNVTYAALVPNAKGVLNAVNSKTDEIAIFASASEKFSQTNINCSIDESFERFDKIFSVARQHNIPVRGYISCAVGCPYEGAVSPDAVARLTDRLWKKGCREISICDTIGVGTPESIDTMLNLVLTKAGACPTDAVAIHCHDTKGRALDNILVALDKYGIRKVDSAVGGLGGCPYAGPGVPGNVATEAVVGHLQKHGYSFVNPLKQEELAKIGTWIREQIVKAKAA